MIGRAMLVARRDFIATVGNKAFLIGLLVMPLIIGLFAVLVPQFMNSRGGPQVRGEVAVIDLSGVTLPELREALSPAVLESLAARARVMPAGVPPPAGMNSGPTPGMVVAAAPPALTLIERPAGDLQQQKNWLIQPPNARPAHLALIVVEPDAVVRPEGERNYGSYELYASRGLGDATETVIHEGLRRALVASRFKAAGLDQEAVERSLRVVRPRAVIVAATGEKVAQRGLSRALPFVCGILLFIGVVTGGQLLLSSTVEEKSNRVVEVLLAAVSPMELMVGKLLAQLGVGFVILALYVGLGIFALAQFSLLSLIDPMLIAYLVAFYVITYLVYGSLLLAIGAAVNQIQDAQSLMGPVMLLLVVPYILTQFIGQAPNSPVSVVLSFIPPINTFAMLARVASDSPPPAWQVCATLAIGVGAAAGVVWFAAKIFKIGLLMHGKPPNIATLVRWARMA